MDELRQDPVAAEEVFSTTVPAGQRMFVEFRVPGELIDDTVDVASSWGCLDKDCVAKLVIAGMADRVQRERATPDSLV